MAFTITSKTNTHSNTDATSYTSASISVSSGDLLVVCASGGLSGGGGVPIDTITGTLGSTLTWTKHVEQDMQTSANTCVTIWTAPVPADASGTLTFNHTTTMGNFSAHTLTVTGADNANPVRQTHSWATGDANPSQNFPSSVLSTSMVIASISTNESATVTAGSGYTAIGTQSARTTPTQTLASQYDLTAANTIAFSIAGVFNRAIAAIEIREAPPSLPPIPRQRRHQHLIVR